MRPALELRWAIHYSYIMDTKDPSEADILEEIVPRIQTSSLSEEDRTIWFTALVTMPLPLLDALSVILKDSSMTLEDLTRGIKDKARAISQKDQEAWEDGVRNERTALNALV